ncbi:MAG: ACP S-malonyltransferase [Pyrinomonadaceae bacterium]
MALAYIFPGQGSQYAGMGKDLADNFAAAKRIFEEADDAVGFSISRLCFEGPADELQLTENTQPAILAVSAAALAVLRTEELAKPNYVAGHSLGEYSALYAAGSLSLADALRTVRARGQYMQQAVPVGVGAMAAILGAELAVVEAACEEARDGQVCSPANINSPGQIVIAGNAEAIDRAIDLLKARGAKRAVKLNVSAPFHCALMQPAQERLANDLAHLQFQELQTPLVNNVDAAANTDGARARDALIRQVSAPVRWRESVELLLREGVNTFIEVGPGKVLGGLLRQIDRSVQSLNVADAASLKATLAACSGAN